MKDLFDFAEFNGRVPVLLPVQESLLTRGRDAYLNGVKRVVWQAPCGSGKTIVAGEQTRLTLLKRPDATVLHIVHRRRLVDQMIRTLDKFGIDSDPIMEGRHRSCARVQCASRDTLLSMLKDGRDLPRPALIVWDECHVAARALQVWYLQHHPQAYWTGYTATPVCSDGRSLAPPYESLVCMAPTSEMIACGRLCPVKVYNPDAIGQRRRKGEKVKPVGDPIDHWKRYASGLPTVVFAANVADSKSIAARYVAAGISAEHIDATTPEDEREAVFDRSERGETKIICNCGVLVEGVDLPWLVCCQILRGCSSLVLWVQATGRVMRTFAGKSHGIVLDHAGAAHEFGLPDSDYQWELGDANANERKNKPPKDRKPVSCSGCGAVFVGKQACPECGKVLPMKKRKSLMDGLHTGDAVLTEFTDGQQDHIRRETLTRLWRKLLFMGRAKNWPMRQVAGVFSKEAGCAPWEAGIDVPMPRGRDEWSTPCREWIEENVTA